MPADMLGFRNTNSFTLDNYFYAKESFTNLPGTANTGVLLFVGLYFFCTNSGLYKYESDY